MSGVVGLGTPQTALARLGNDRQSSSVRIVCKLAASGRIFALLSRMHGRICALAGGPQAPILTGAEALFGDVVELSSRPPLWGNCGGYHLVSLSALAVYQPSSVPVWEKKGTCKPTEELRHDCNYKSQPHST